MAVARSRVESRITSPDLWTLTKSFERSLLAANRSPATVRVYRIGLEQFGKFLEAQGMPLAVASITREHVETFIADVLRRNSPSTGLTRYAALRAFFKWAVEEGEIKASPMAHTKPPTVPVNPPPVLSADELNRLLKACGGKDFTSRRDTAIFNLLIDTGARRSEIAYLKLSDVDLDNNIIVVTGKGRRMRVCPFGRKTAVSLDRYLRVRSAHRHADSEYFWLGKYGPLNDSALDLMIRRRAKQAGLKDVYAHKFRHGFAHSWLAEGGAEQDLMMLAGWRSRTMLGRYGASAAAERAREQYRRRTSPRDRL